MEYCNPALQGARRKSDDGVIYRASRQVSGWALWVMTTALVTWPATGATTDVYRTVGPNGRVTFTDKPPAASLTFSSSPPVALSPMKATAQGMSSEAPGKPQPSMPSDTAAPPTHQPSAPSTLAPNTRALLLGAALEVDILSRLVQSRQSLCSTHVPASAASVEVATDQWFERHEWLLSKKERILRDLLPSDRPDLRRADNDPADAVQQDRQTLMTASPDKRAASCMAWPAALVTSAMNLPPSVHLETLVSAY